MTARLIIHADTDGAKNYYLSIDFPSLSDRAKSIAENRMQIDFAVAFDHQPVRSFLGVVGLRSCAVEGQCEGCEIETRGPQSASKADERLYEIRDGETQSREAMTGARGIGQAITGKLASKSNKSHNEKASGTSKKKHQTYFVFSSGKNPEWRFWPSPEDPLPLLQGRSRRIRIIVTLSPDSSAASFVLSANVLRHLAVFDNLGRRCPLFLGYIAKALAKWKLASPEVKAELRIHEKIDDVR